MRYTRRKFIAAAALSSAAISLPSSDAQNADPMQGHMQNHAMHEHPKPERPKIPRLPALICRMAATKGLDEAYRMLTQREDTLIAALHLAQAREDDPNDSSTGLGSLPNAEGDIQLDACCFHGPSRRVAAVGAVRGIRNASLLARALMDRSGYSLLVGADAERFALAEGFKKENLLTDRSRLVWEVQKRILRLPKTADSVIYDPAWPKAAQSAHFLSASQKDLDALVRQYEPLAKEAGLGPQWTWRAAYDALFPASTPLYIGAVNEKNEMSSVATTSGLPWRMAGATSDVAVIGAGCYLDPEVGSAGASGNAEANIKVAGARIIVEKMRQGMSPEDAGMECLRDIVRWHNNDMTALRFVDIVYYILRKDGAYGCVSLWHGDRTGHVRQFEIHDGIRRSEDCRFLLEGNPANGLQASA